MTCIFCADWNQDDPNCGHVLLNGTLLPRQYATRAWTARSEIGRGSYLDAESTGSQATRIDHINRQVGHALAGGWRRAGSPTKETP